jgi:type VI secretion system protein ImpH
MPDLIGELLRAPQRFDLFQAIHLLERAAQARAPVGTGVGMDEAVRLAAHVDMAFAPSDIASLEESKAPGPQWVLRTPALSLAGAQGPLAAPFTELLLERRARRDRGGLDFLDIFNGRMLGFRHRARAKMHLALQPAGANPLLTVMDQLSGLGRGAGARGPAGEAAWLRHAGVQNAAPRSLTSLLVVLRDRLGVHFCGEQFVGGWHALAPNERARLAGSRTRRSGRRAASPGVSLGGRAWDQSAGIALRAPLLDRARFAALLPGGAHFGLLGWLVARHLQADFTVSLTLGLNEAPVSRLGASALMPPRLGRSAWLSSRSGAAAIYRHARFALAAYATQDT